MFLGCKGKGFKGWGREWRRSRRRVAVMDGGGEEAKVCVKNKRLVLVIRRVYRVIVTRVKFI